MPKSKCASLRAKSQVAQSNIQNSGNAANNILPSFQNINFFGKDFMDSLLNFMQHSHNFLLNWKQETGRQQYSMSNEERLTKVKQIMTLISQKEKELSELQAMKAQLTNDDSFSTYSVLTEDFGPSIRTTNPQPSYDYSVAFPDETFDDDVPTDPPQFPSTPDYSSYDTQALSTPGNRATQYPPGYEHTEGEYNLLNEGPTKYYRSQ